MDERREPERGASCRQRSRAVLAWSLVAAGALIASSALLVSREWGTGLGLVIALAPVLPFVGMFFALRRSMALLDEMQKKIQLEALARCVVLASVICVVIGQLQKLGIGSGLDLSMGWVAIAGSYIASYLLVRSRYR